MEVLPEQEQLLKEAVEADGGQSYYTQPASNNTNPIPTHTRTSTENGQVIISMIGI